MKLSPIILAALALAGCAAPIAPKIAAQSVSTVSANLDNAAQNIDLAKPHTDTVGKAFLTSAGNNVAMAKAQVPTLEKTAGDYATVTDDLAKERAQFFSAKQRALFWWAIAFGAVLLVLYCLGGSGIVGVGATVLFHTLTLGVGVVLKKIRGWVDDLKAWLVKPKAPAAPVAAPQP